MVSYLGRLAAIAAGNCGNILNDAGLITDGEKGPDTPGGWVTLTNDAGLITEGEKARYAGQMWHSSQRHGASDQLPGRMLL